MPYGPLPEPRPAHSSQHGDIADAILSRHYRDPTTRLPTLAYWGSTFYVFERRGSTRRWRALQPGTLEPRLIDNMTGLTILNLNGPAPTEELVSTSTHAAAAVSMCLQRKVDVDSDVESPPLWLGRDQCPTNPLTTIATQNHLIDLETGSVFDRGIEWFDTVVCPFDYDPEATCPLFDNYLERCGTGPEWVELVLRMMAYCQVADRSFHKFFVVGVTPRSGKSLLNNLQRHMLGGTVSKGGGFEEREVGSFGASDHATSGLDQARLLAINETQDLGPAGLRSLHGKLLRLVGDETLYINKKYAHPYTAIHRIKVKLTGNEVPKMADPGNSLWTKAVFVPFNKPIPEDQQDERLLQKMIREGPGILNKVIEAGRRLYGDVGVPFPKVETDMLDEVRMEANSPAVFLEQRCRRSGAAPISELYRAYLRWCLEKEIEALAQNVFTSRVVTAWGLTRKQVRVGAARVWCLDGVEVVG